MGLPGDLSSASRFVRAVYVRAHAFSEDSEEVSVSQMFHILHSVEQQLGCCEVEEEAFAYTIYTSCRNANRSIYYDTAYDRHQITAVDLHRCDPESRGLTRYPLLTREEFARQN